MKVRRMVRRASRRMERYNSRRCKTSCKRQTSACKRCKRRRKNKKRRKEKPAANKCETFLPLKTLMTLNQKTTPTPTAKPLQRRGNEVRRGTQRNLREKRINPTLVLTEVRRNTGKKLATNERE